MLVAAGQLLHLHLLLLPLALQQEIRQGLDLGYVAHVADLADAQLALQVAAECVHLERVAESVQR